MGQIGVKMKKLCIKYDQWQFYKYFEINFILKIIKNRIKTILWTGRHFWKTIGAETENLGAYVELCSTKGGLWVDLRKLQGLFSKIARLTGSPPRRPHGDRRWLLSGGFMVDCLCGMLRRRWAWSTLCSWTEEVSSNPGRSRWIRWL